MILVTGASGNVGGAVLTTLIAAGAAVRASSRSPRPGQFSDEGEVVSLDLDAPETFPHALDGVDKVFLYARPETAADFAAAARDAGVEHVVVLSSASVISASTGSDPIAEQHRAVEKAVQESGLGWTFVRPGYYASNMLRWQSIRTRRELRTAFPNAVSSPVHERDIAEVAAASLLDDTQRGKAHAVLGPGPSTVRQQVAAIAHALDEAVDLVEIDTDTYRTELLTQLPPFVVDRVIEAQGNMPMLPAGLAADAVESLLGRPPLTIETWAQDHVQDFR
ncbi:MULTISPECIES: NAD(P)H-binding protein [unclassified Curtobacterium]|uniref:SDR family oxidoreductase n=1 Tax=unclassified Curtobacterium TaxID=257496 RepID=UPI00281545B2|nr:MULTISPECIES: NAD(P)H-binding protein [unclassified Curtobacterium]